MAPRLDISDTFGACFVALLIAMVLYGISIFQTYTYYLRFPKDTWTKKWLVGVVCVIDTFQTILITHGIYYYVILNYNNPEALASGVWSFILEVVVTDVIACIVQCFFASQVFFLGSRAWVLTGAITSLAIIQAVFSLAFTVKGFHSHAFAALVQPVFKGFLLTHLITSLAADMLITLGLCYYLQTARTGYSQTEYLINKLLVYTINRGVLTGLSALLELVFYLAMPSNFVFIGVHFITSKLYVVSFMATLNIRQPSKIVNISLSNISGSGSGQAQTHSIPNPVIRVTRNVEKRVDESDSLPMDTWESSRPANFPKFSKADSDDDFLYPNKEPAQHGLSIAV